MDIVYTKVIHNPNYFVNPQWKASKYRLFEQFNTPRINWTYMTYRLSKEYPVLCTLNFHNVVRWYTILISLETWYPEVCILDIHYFKVWIPHIQDIFNMVYI